MCLYARVLEQLVYSVYNFNFISCREAVPHTVRYVVCVSSSLDSVVYSVCTLTIFDSVS